MKLHHLDRKNTTNQSFTVKLDEYPYFLKCWHYHEELELVLILESKGNCFIGDTIERFDAGDVFLIGKNLPHMWLNDEDYFQENSTKIARAVVIQFEDGFFGKGFFERPEMNHIKDLFNNARLGLKFLKIDKFLTREIERLTTLKGFEKAISFLMILNNLSLQTNISTLSSLGFVNSFKPDTNDTQNKVHSYIFKNFNKGISLREAANVANMHPSAFSRSFKRINRKTFSKYVAEIRIGYACKMIIENKLSMAGICYECGFNNLSNFNRQFKQVMQCTPSEYFMNYQLDSSTA